MMLDLLQENAYLDEEALDTIQGFFESNVNWTYGWQSVVGDAPFSHWNRDFLKTSRRNEDDCAPALQADPTLAPLAALWAQLERELLPGHALVRCYANAHTYGIEGYPHVDSKKPGHYTTIFYINPVWKPEWAGETVFFDAGHDIVRAILPKPGRMIIFDGNVLHAARGVSRTCPAMRVTLMFKSTAPAGFRLGPRG